MAMSVSVAVHSCLESFSNLHEAVSSQILSHDTSPDVSLLLSRSQAAIEDAAGRFRVWSGNIGAHQIPSSKSSLDYRLRDNENIMIRFVSLLQDLNELLQEVSEIIQGREPLEAIDDENLSDSGSDDDSPRFTETSDTEQILYNVSQIINSLYRLSMTVRTTSSTSRYVKSRSIDISHFERYDIDHVRYKFPSAPNFLIERLGKAISRRRQYLKYRERHATKLASTTSVSVDDLSETVASTLVEDNALASNEPKNGYDRPPSLTTETSFATTIGDTGRPRLPLMPNEAANEQPFECPYCRTVTTVENTRAWKKHVYRDLQPYVCTFEECLTPDDTYESRHRWFSHELQKHRRIWTCGSHCSLAFPSANRLVEHINSISSIPIKNEQIPILIEMRATSFDQAKSSMCLLCKSLVSGSTQLMKHIGHHLEELSLFALPISDKNSDDLDNLQPISSASLNSAEGSEQEVDTVSLKNNAEDRLPLHETEKEEMGQTKEEGDSPMPPRRRSPARDSKQELKVDYRDSASAKISKRKMNTTGEYAWYCCQCMAGPYTRALILQCIECAHHLCSTCQVYFAD